ncbi:MAG: hypothetical protein FD167_1604 [bacterium]|nr:MAG: hypothetical protein FD167_1604 [bacterium]
MWTINILFFLAIVVAILLSRHEIRRYTDARISGTLANADRHRFTRRMIGTSILTLFLVMTYFGYAYKEIFINRPWFFGVYWTICILLAPLLVFVALMDARAIFRQSMGQYMSEDKEAERLQKFLNKEKSEKN